MFWNNSWFFPSHEFIFILIHEIFFDFFLAKNVKIRKIFTHGYSYNNQNILTWMNLLEWSSYMHISLCVVSVMAAAAADFPRLAKWLAAANLRQHTSVSLLYQTPILFVPPLVECFPSSGALVALHHWLVTGGWRVETRGHAPSTTTSTHCRGPTTTAPIIKRMFFKILSNIVLCCNF